ncbi:hypothetical protein E1287_02065 [Actinomadura sp. KC06]|uniref:hypothetical protein n=1 Tax=Actinomadura sp. KC06 TaxID=2530369 RepID=UPI0010435378|nr:hypothetical protein [Actinomadura sp. KC06]TDD39982.1 hypothetical protein E1287_02065 [Actinomadura sp. KC06]
MTPHVTRAEASMPAIGTAVRLPKVATMFPVDCHPDTGAVENHLLEVVDRPYVMRYWGSEDAVRAAYARQSVVTWAACAIRTRGSGCSSPWHAR